MGERGKEMVVVVEEGGTLSEGEKHVLSPGHLSVCVIKLNNPYIVPRYELLGVS